MLNGDWEMYVSDPDKTHYDLRHLRIPPIRTGNIFFCIYNTYYQYHHTWAFGCSVESLDSCITHDVCLVNSTDY